MGGVCSHHPEPVAVNLNITDEPLIVLKDLKFFRGNKLILNNINLCVNKGDFVAITGPNGGGKTTLLRIILGLLKPSKGSVEIQDESVRIGYLPQKNMIDAQFPITVREVIGSGLLYYKGISSSKRNEMIDDTLKRIELSEFSSHPIGQLSGGQLQRVLLGRAIISKPSLLVLDEPLSYIDKHFEAHIYRIIAEIAPHCTVILVSHEMTTIATMANRHLIVDKDITECSATHHYLSTYCDNI